MCRKPCAYMIMIYPNQDENDKVRVPGQIVDDLVRNLRQIKDD